MDLNLRTPSLFVVAALGLTATAPAFQLQTLRSMTGQRAMVIQPAPTGTRILAGMEDFSVRIIDASNRQTLRTFRDHPQQPMAVAWSRDARWVASGDESGRIFVWNPANGQRRHAIQGGHQRGIQALAFDDTGTRLLSVGKDDVIKVWNMNDGKPVSTILGRGANFYAAQFMPRSTDILVATLGKGAVIYAVNGTQRTAFGGHGGQGCYGVAFAPQSARVVSAGRDNLGQVWDQKTGRRLANLAGHTDWVMHTAVSPNGLLIATGSVDGTVRVWDMRTFRTLATISEQSMVGSPVAFTADGRFLVTLNQFDEIQIHQLTPAQR